MPLSWIALILVGALLGWLASVVLHSDRARDVLGLVALGAVGALLGAMLITPALAGKLEPTGFSLPGVLLSLIGAFLALGIVAAASRIGRRRAR
ncbi:GlsB/YeaQ/YmgE family stress response membrane protein [Sphingomonas sp. LHG3443-2]|uniref:GlsB/YeaQ/YmgE family stress response membrane protein n=1 Tax=Sphingomonas sp. LHG3443-2 TaxID=2804639 RepID=UPI003CF09E72